MRFHAKKDTLRERGGSPGQPRKEVAELNMTDKNHFFARKGEKRKQQHRRRGFQFMRKKKGRENAYLGRTGLAK